MNDFEVNLIDGNPSNVIKEVQEGRADLGIGDITITDAREEVCVFVCVCMCVFVHKCACVLVCFEYFVNILYCFVYVLNGCFRKSMLRPFFR